MVHSLLTPIRFVYDFEGANALDLPALLVNDVNQAIYDLAIHSGDLSWKVSDGKGGFTAVSGVLDFDNDRIEALITANTTAIATNTGNITIVQGLLSDLTAIVTTNTANILAHTTELSALDLRIESITELIQTNITGVATNLASIGSNTIAITALGVRIDNLPEPIPQAQSNWAETDSTNRTFIANKPTIPDPLTHEQENALQDLTVIEEKVRAIRIDTNSAFRSNSELGIAILDDIPTNSILTSGSRVYRLRITTTRLRHSYVVVRSRVRDLHLYRVIFTDDSGEVYGTHSSIVYRTSVGGTHYFALGGASDSYAQYRISGGTVISVEKQTQAVVDHTWLGALTTSRVESALGNLADRGIRPTNIFYGNHAQTDPKLNDFILSTDKKLYRGVAGQSNSIVWQEYASFIHPTSSQLTAVQVRNRLESLSGVQRLPYTSISNTPVPLTSAQVRDRLTALSGTARLPASAIRDLPSGGGGTSDTATQIKTKLETLEDEARLSATAIKDLPTVINTTSLTEREQTVLDHIEYTEVETLPALEKVVDNPLDVPFEGVYHGLFNEVISSRVSNLFPNSANVKTQPANNVKFHYDAASNVNLFSPELGSYILTNLDINNPTASNTYKVPRLHFNLLFGFKFSLTNHAVDSDVLKLGYGREALVKFSPKEGLYLQIQRGTSTSSRVVNHNLQVANSTISTNVNTPVTGEQIINIPADIPVSGNASTVQIEVRLYNNDNDEGTVTIAYTRNFTQNASRTSVNFAFTAQSATLRTMISYDNTSRQIRITETLTNAALSYHIRAYYRTTETVTSGGGYVRYPINPGHGHDADGIFNPDLLLRSPTKVVLTTYPRDATSNPIIGVKVSVGNNAGHRYFDVNTKRLASDIFYSPNNLINRPTNIYGNNLIGSIGSRSMGVKDINIYAPQINTVIAQNTLTSLFNATGDFLGLYTFASHTIDNMNILSNSLTVNGSAITGGSGTPGPQGIQGDQGAKGGRGPQGIPGPQGIQGDQGAKGGQGDRGLPGQQGIPGTDGQDGADGADGAIGTAGTNGLPGGRGPQGIPGPRGIEGGDGGRGLQGEQGVAGGKGDKGDRGLPGQQGIQGVAGGKGDKGDQGEAGVGGSAETAAQVVTKLSTLRGTARLPASAINGLPVIQGITGSIEGNIVQASNRNTLVGGRDVRRTDIVLDTTANNFYRPIFGREIGTSSDSGTYVPAKDFNFTSANNAAQGGFRSGDYNYIVDFTGRKAYAYHYLTTVYTSSKDFNFTGANATAQGGFRSGDYNYIVDFTDRKAYAYHYLTNVYTSSKDFNFTSANATAFGGFRSGDYNFIVDLSGRKAYAYHYLTNVYTSSKDFNFTSSNSRARGGFRSGNYNYIVDETDRKAYAYHYLTNVYTSSKDFNFTSANTGVFGGFRSGDYNYIVDDTNHKAYAYQAAIPNFAVTYQLIGSAGGGGGLTHEQENAIADLSLIEEKVRPIILNTHSNYSTTTDLAMTILDSIPTNAILTGGGQLYRTNELVTRLRHAYVIVRSRVRDLHLYRVIFTDASGVVYGTHSGIQYRTSSGGFHYFVLGSASDSYAQYRLSGQTRITAQKQSQAIDHTWIGDLTSNKVKASLESLSGTARLPASAIRDLPSGGGSGTRPTINKQLHSVTLGRQDLSIPTTATQTTRPVLNNTFLTSGANSGRIHQMIPLRFNKDVEGFNVLGDNTKYNSTTGVLTIPAGRKFYISFVYYLIDSVNTETTRIIPSAVIKQGGKPVFADTQWIRGIGQSQAIRLSPQSITGCGGIIDTNGLPITFELQIQANRNVNYIIQGACVQMAELLV